MCGIVGLISKDKDKNKLIKDMTDRIVHRGPDAYGEYVDEYVALGHRRLSIIDLEGGNQPIYNEDKSILVIFNGEIYNYKDLRKELEDKHTFVTNSDTEVLVHGYEEWGKDLPKKLRGMFTFCIYDTNKKEAFIARDQFGIKPLYYYHEDDVILFGSEIKSFLAYPKFKKELNKEILASYLTFSFTPTKETFFKNVFRLEAGHYMTIGVDTLECSISRYFNLRFKDTDNSYEEMVDEIEKIMKNFQVAEDPSMGGINPKPDIIL